MTSSKGSRAARRSSRTLAALPSLDGPLARLRSDALPAHALSDARLHDSLELLIWDR
ncbi:hypothetical protein [Nocardioides speluncae]|uniref:hypothetical protein n=1 Tax=Nocardioides speluncae TaxID=2670337 RepID=UPI0012B16B12|nr:hypothetical protein [Nocardioides speluncae]